MKKKAAIVTIIISGIIIWVLTAFAVSMRQTQTLAYTDIVKEAGNNVTYVQRSRKPIYFLPVGKECEFLFSVTGPDEIKTKISISLGSPKAEPIFTTTVSNKDFSTGTLNVDDKEIYINCEYEYDGELSADKEYGVRYTIELNSGNYALYNGIMVAVAALCIIPLGISVSYLTSLNENNAKAYDERQMRMRGKAAMSTLIVVIISAMGLGLMSMIYKGYPLNVYDSMMIVVFIGIATFAITADRYDAYMGLSKKRVPFAIAFSVIGLIDILMFICNLKLILMVNGLTNIVSSLVQGICCLAIGIEMITKNIKDKKEALADEES